MEWLLLQGSGLERSGTVAVGGGGGWVGVSWPLTQTLKTSSSVPFLNTSLFFISWEEAGCVVKG